MRERGCHIGGPFYYPYLDIGEHTSYQESSISLDCII